MIAYARADPGIAIGVDIGGTKVFGVVLGPRRMVLAEARLPTPQPEDRPGRRPAIGPGEDVADAVAAVVASLR